MVVNAGLDPAMDGGDRRPLLTPSAAPPVVKTYKRRWYILAVYSALGFMQVGSSCRGSNVTVQVLDGSLMDGLEGPVKRWFSFQCLKAYDDRP